MKRWIIVTTALVLGSTLIQLLMTHPVAAQTEQRNWPQRTVRLILPFGPASGADTAARLLVERLQVVWGKPVVVEGKPGGDGLLSITTVVNARDDHVLFFGPSSAYVVHPYVHENLPYDPERDLQPIAGVARVLVSVAVPSSLGTPTMKEFVAHARANPGKLSYGVAPGFSEFVFNGFLRETGLEMAKVPYRDITTAPTDLGEGRLQLLMQSYAAMRAGEQTGKIKVIAITDRKRAEIAPNIPSIVEAGFPSLEAVAVLGMLGPREMALDVRRRAGAEVAGVLSDKSVAERLAVTGQMPDAMELDAFAEAIKHQHERVAAIAKVLGMSRKR
jgi:tripartite-type tricarboxylate transporter receptor subunit TctC